MNCEEVWESSSALCSGELSPDEIREIMAHTEKCDHCRTWLGTMRNVWVFLDCWRVPSAPEGCLESFRKQLARVNQQHKKSWKFWETRQFSGPGFLVPGLAFVMVIGLLVAAASLQQFSGRGTGIGSRSRSTAERRSNREDGALASSDTAFDTELANNDVSDDGYNRLPETLRHAGPLSLPAQESVGVILVSDEPYRRDLREARVSPDVLRVVPAGHTH